DDDLHLLVWRGVRRGHGRHVRCIGCNLRRVREGWTARARPPGACRRIWSGTLRARSPGPDPSRRHHAPDYGRGRSADARVLFGRAGGGATHREPRCVIGRFRPWRQHEPEPCPGRQPTARPGLHRKHRRRGADHGHRPAASGRAWHPKLMALATYNGDVVIPHRPDWRQRVAWSRAWDTSIESGLTGAEDRRAMRLKPRERIVFRVIPWNAEERIRLLERLKAGVKAGRVLVPNWGRGATLAAGASGTSLAIASPAFTIHSANPVFIG